MSEPRTAAGKRLVEDEPRLITGEHSMLVRVLAIEYEARAAALAEARETVEPTLRYALLQAEMTFDPLVRDGLLGGKREHKRMQKAGIAGTPSTLTVWLREALVAIDALAEEP